jgi:hypothetical protein
VGVLLASSGWASSCLLLHSGCASLHFRLSLLLRASLLLRHLRASLLLHSDWAFLASASSASSGFSASPGFSASLGFSASSASSGSASSGFLAPASVLPSGSASSGVSAASASSAVSASAPVLLLPSSGWASASVLLLPSGCASASSGASASSAFQNNEIALLLLRLLFFGLLLLQLLFFGLLVRRLLFFGIHLWDWGKLVCFTMGILACANAYAMGEKLAQSNFLSHFQVIYNCLPEEFPPMGKGTLLPTRALAPPPKLAQVPHLSKRLWFFTPIG